MTRLVACAGGPRRRARRLPPRPSRSRAPRRWRRALERNPDVPHEPRRPRLPARAREGGARRRAAGAERPRLVPALPGPGPLQQPQLRRVPARGAAGVPPAPAEPLGRLAGAQADALELQPRQGDPRRALRRAAGRRERAHAPARTSALATVHAYNAYLLALEQARGGREGRHTRRRSTSRWRRTAARPGVATELDVLRFEVDLANARATLLRLRGRGRPGARRPECRDGAARPTRPSSRPTRSSSCDETAEQAAGRRATRPRAVPRLKAVAWNEKIYDEADRHRTRPTCSRGLDFDGAYGWSVREPGNFLESNFAALERRGHAQGAGLRRLPHAPARSRRRAPSATKVEQDRIALENRRSAWRRSRRVDRLRVAASVLRAAELNVAQARAARSR